MTKSRRMCRWKEGTRTACPVIIDNLSEEEVDFIWGEISQINWEHRFDDWQIMASLSANRGISNSEKNHTRRRAKSKSAS
jgi:hypothetical protein